MSGYEPIPTGMKYPLTTFAFSSDRLQKILTLLSVTETAL